MLNVYAEFAEKFLAVPVICGIKTENERFAGAVETYCIEGLMQDGKALQMGTSHFLGQNFAKAFDVKFQTKEGKLEHVWATSWGVSTRLIGALIMAHSDDEGLVLPPSLAPIQVVIVPIYRSDEERLKVEAAAEQIKQKLEDLDLSVKFDNRDTYKPGYKFAEWELKGVPVRIAIGPRDIENGTVELARRDTKEKSVTSIDGIDLHIKNLLSEIQSAIYERAKLFRDQSIHVVNSWEEFKEVLNTKGGFISAHWDGSGETEEKIKELTKATIRCIPLDNIQEDGICVLTGNPSKQRVLFAKAY
jgi:prolyl-tRNA synthetase